MAKLLGSKRAETGDNITKVGLIESYSGYVKIYGGVPKKIFFFGVSACFIIFHQKCSYVHSLQKMLEN